MSNIDFTQFNFDNTTSALDLIRDFYLKENSNDLSKNINPLQVCESCNIPMLLDANGSFYHCSQCFLIKKQEQTEVISKDYTFGGTITTGSGRIYTPSDYRIKQYKLVRENYYSILKGHSEFNKDIIAQAVDLFHKGIQQNKIVRNSKKKGCQAFCLYWVCKKNHFPKKPEEIIKIFNIPAKKFSTGETIFKSLVMLDLIEKPILSPDIITHDYLVRYYSALDIDSKYLIFGNRLVYFTLKYHILSTSRISSKCAGTAHLILKSKKVKITQDEISERCCISKSTFSKFTKAIIKAMSEDTYNARRLKHLFKKNNLDLP